MVSDSIPPNSFRSEYKPRSSQCTHTFHRTDSKDPDIHVLDGWMPATKTHPACTIHEDGMWLPQWLDEKKTNGHICKNLTQNGEPQRYSWGTQKKTKRCRVFWAYLSVRCSSPKTLTHNKKKAIFHSKTGGYKTNQGALHQLPRHQQTTIFRLRTGHCRLNSHLKRIGVKTSAQCPCGEADQTPEHYLKSCSSTTKQGSRYGPLVCPSKPSLGVCRGFVPDIQVCSTHKREDLVNAASTSNQKKKLVAIAGPTRQPRREVRIRNATASRIVDLFQWFRDIERLARFEYCKCISMPVVAGEGRTV